MSVRRLAVGLGLAALTAGALAGTSRPAPTMLATPIRQVQSAGWTVTWTEREATAKPAVQAATVGATAKWAPMTLYAQPEARACPSGAPAARLRGAVLALVGRYASAYTERQDDCGAHPTDERVYTTVDLQSGSEAPVNLLDLFPERAVLAALLTDPVVKAALRGQRPNSIEALAQAYGEHGCTVLDKDALGNFAFYDARPGRVAVRVSLPYASYSCRPGFTQILLWLPAPRAMQADLNSAKQARALMVDLKKQTRLVR